MIQHGTYGGYQQETRLGEEHCERCRKAAALYQKRYRAVSPSRRRSERLGRKASAQAHAELARRYPGVYNELRREALQRLESEESE